MSIKTKVALGVAFLFAMILTIGGMGLYYLEDLSGDSRNILTNNYETLEYTKRIIESLDKLKTDSVGAFEIIEKNLRLQEDNITEAGERELTHSLRVALEKLKNSRITDGLIMDIRTAALAIQEINMQAIKVNI